MFNWGRGTNRALSAYFQSKEFTCKCGICADQRIDEKLIAKLDQVREIYGKPIIITSGFRCPRHQANLRKSLPAGHTAVGRSTHEEGQAADITGDDVPRLEKICLMVFDSVGTAKNFVHVDIRPKKADGTKRVWKYV